MSKPFTLQSASEQQDVVDVVDVVDALVRTFGGYLRAGVELLRDLVAHAEYDDIASRPELDLVHVDGVGPRAGSGQLLNSEAIRLPFGDRPLEEPLEVGPVNDEALARHSG